MATLSLRDLRFSYSSANNKGTQEEQVILDIDALTLPSGQHLGLQGASGSGKTTLLNILSGITVAQQGEVLWDDLSLKSLSEAARDRWRGQHIGSIFQDFRLFEPLSALDNVLLPVTFHAFRIPQALYERACMLLDSMHIVKERKARFLSRGEKQRVAIARAVLLKPQILLADEPTASLDKNSALQVTLLLKELATTLQSTLIIVSHDRTVLEQMPRILTLERGHLVPQGA